jgi:hypothetical protein
VDDRGERTKKGRWGFVSNHRSDTDSKSCSTNKHGKQKFQSCNIPPPTTQNQVPGTHYRTCKLWQDIHLAESVRHYGQPRNLSSHGPPQRAGTQSNISIIILVWSHYHQVQLDPSMDVGDNRTLLWPSLIGLTLELAWRTQHRG